MDITEALRDGAERIEIDGTPSQVGPSPVELRYAADEIVRLRRELRDLQTGVTCVMPQTRDHAQKLLGMAETFWHGNAHVVGWVNR